jgi:hypothetical protein
MHSWLPHTVVYMRSTDRMGATAKVVSSNSENPRCLLINFLVRSPTEGVDVQVSLSYMAVAEVGPELPQTQQKCDRVARYKHVHYFYYFALMDRREMLVRPLSEKTLVLLLLLLRKHMGPRINHPSTNDFTSNKIATTSCIPESNIWES